MLHGWMSLQRCIPASPVWPSRMIGFSGGIGVCMQCFRNSGDEACHVGEPFRKGWEKRNSKACRRSGEPSVSVARANAQTVAGDRAYGVAGVREWGRLDDRGVLDTGSLE